MPVTGMPEHWIRLRGAWEWHDANDQTDLGRRVTLPLRWPEGPDTSVRLVRRFNAPPVDLRHETLSLRLEHVPGLLAIRLNGHPFEGPLEDTLSLDLGSFGSLAAKNVLELVVAPDDAVRAVAEWGAIALVVDSSSEGRRPSPGESC